MAFKFSNTDYLSGVVASSPGIFPSSVNMGFTIWFEIPENTPSNQYLFYFWSTEDQSLFWARISTNKQITVGCRTADGTTAGGNTPVLSAGIHQLQVRRGDSGSFTLEPDNNNASTTSMSGNGAWGTLTNVVFGRTNAGAEPYSGRMCWFHVQNTSPTNGDQTLLYNSGVAAYAPTVNFLKGAIGLHDSLQPSFGTIALTINGVSNFVDDFDFTGIEWPVSETFKSGFSSGAGNLQILSKQQRVRRIS